jgi:hypothetical protein
MILHTDAETNAPLQERVKKACEFFTDKMSASMHMVMTGITVETDNKEIRKAISEALARVKQETAIKLACLNSIRSGFQVRKYLEAKARAAIDTPPARIPAIKSLEDTSGVIQHPALYTRLKAWRDHMAREMNLPHYMILPQSTMGTLTNFLPQSLPALKQVKGMGKKKSEKFGDGILTIITTYCQEKNIEQPVEIYIEKVTPTKVKVDSKLVSFNLFKTGKTILQIAEERNMAMSTIEGHLAHYIGTGDIPILEFVSHDISTLIASHFEGKGDYHMGTVKAALGDQVSWSEIRFVMKHLEFKRKPR